MTADRATDERTRRGWGVWIAGLVLLPLLYVLSIGPAAWLLDHGYMSEPVEEALTVFYTPLVLVYDSNQTFEVALDAYLSLWQP